MVTIALDTYLDSAAAQFNLAKLILRHQGSKTASGVGEATLEAKALLRRVLRDNKDHASASLCLARLLVEEGGTPGVVVVVQTFCFASSSPLLETLRCIKQSKCGLNFLLYLLHFL